MTSHNTTAAMPTNALDLDNAVCYALVDLYAEATSAITVFDAPEADYAKDMLRDHIATRRGMWSLRTLRGELAVKVLDKYNAAIDALCDLPRSPSDEQKRAVTQMYVDCRALVLGL